MHGKGSLLGKMPGDRWQRFANLRAYYGFMWGHPGKKLLFMGGEFGQEREWNHDHSLDWHLLDDPLHRGVQGRSSATSTAPIATCRRCTSATARPAASSGSSPTMPTTRVIAWARFGTDPGRVAIVISNFTPVPRAGYHLGVPLPGHYREVVNTDAALYGGCERRQHGRRDGRRRGGARPSAVDLRDAAAARDDHPRAAAGLERDDFSSI